MNWRLHISHLLCNIRWCWQHKKYPLFSLKCVENLNMAVKSIKLINNNNYSYDKIYKHVIKPGANCWSNWHFLLDRRLLASIVWLAISHASELSVHKLTFTLNTYWFACWRFFTSKLQEKVNKIREMTTIIIIWIMEKKKFFKSRTYSMRTTPCNHTLFVMALWKKKTFILKNMKHLQLKNLIINLFCKILLTHIKFWFAIHTCWQQFICFKWDLLKFPFINSNHYLWCARVNFQVCMEASPQSWAWYTTLYSWTKTRNMTGKRAGEDGQCKVV